MILLEDCGQKINSHIVKNDYWRLNGIEVKRYPLPIGDYVIANDKILDVIKLKTDRNVDIKKMDFVGSYNIAVDTKKDIQELIQDVCTKDHARFRDECILAQNTGVKLFILVEDNGGFCDRRCTIYNKPVKSINDLFSWKNPRAFIFKAGVQKYPKCTKGAVLAKSCLTMEKEYGVKFLFCTKDEAGAKVIEILTKGIA
jgi:ribosome-associated protein